MAALMSTRAVSWNEAAERKLEVVSATLVMPRSSWTAVAGRWPARSMARLISRNFGFSTISPDVKAVSPASLMRTRENIWRVITSMCLSWIGAPWSE